VPRISAYHRPAALPEALALLHRPAVRSVVLAGGTAVVPARVDVATEVIDLQSLGLSAISRTHVVTLGATATLHDVAVSADVPDVVREAARREQPSTLRTLATVGGTVVSGDGESEFLATLLAFDALVSFVNPSGASERPLDDVLADPSVLHGAIVTSVSFDPSGVAAAARTARTPMDTPIVAVVGHRRADGSVVIAASGVASTAVVLGDPSGLEPPGDFRGSTEYRRALAVELVGRVRAAVEVLA
jgi:CO/xanthine dehydrogenase FAD-binding subunit